MIVSIDILALINSIQRTQASKPLAKALRALANALSKSSARIGYSVSTQNISEWAEGKFIGIKF